MLEKELQQREIEIGALNSRVTDAEAEAAQLQNQLVVEERESEKLRKQLAEARRWSDCEKCPWMVSLPGGPFTMGSPENEDGHDHDEEPAREVTVQPFAIGQYEVTFDEWDTCVADGACLDRPKEADWGNRPVINVSWNDAKEYVVWLSKKTRQFYRLPSEAEWEYAARAGAGTRYWWGNQASPEHANYDGNVGEPTDVGSYPANPFGLYDMHGNVWEWVEDCWHASYGGAPSDGSAWRGGNCSFRVVRGGSWNNRPWNVRSATREGQKPVNQSRYLGIRVARTLTP
jgi:formylglycine-generating enzyme required for sulfatase activity